MFGLLFAGTFAFSSPSRKLGEALLAAAILSFGFLYQMRNHHLQGRVPELNAAVAGTRVRNQFLFLVLLVSFLMLLRQYPLCVLLLLFVPTFRDYLFRLTHSTSILSDSPLKLEFQAIFKRAGVTLREIYLINSSTNNPSSTAMVAGRSLFLTLDLFSKLNESELKAVVCHEASHLRLRHPWKRTIAAIGSTLLAFFWFYFPLSINHFSDMRIIFYVIPLIALVQNSILSRIARRQEIEADLGALDLGATDIDLISALQKLSPYPRAKKNWSSRQIFGNTHPSVEDRVWAILNRKVADNFYFNHKKYAYAYSVLVFGYAFTQAQKLNLNLNRYPASDLNAQANIAHLEPNSTLRNVH